MKKSIRLAFFACAAISALAFAGTALASFGGQLVVSSSPGGTRVGVMADNADAPTAQVTIYVPTAYQVGTPAAGTKLGSVTATAAALDLGGIVLPLTGELDAIAPTSTTTADAQACGVTPTQTWDLHLDAAGTPLDIPLFVVTAPAPVAAAGYGTELVVCLPPPDVPVGTPGRSFDGAKLLSTTFTSSAITEPTTAGDYRWTSTWTPYTPNTGKPNAAGTVETQSIRHIPAALALTVRKKKITTIKRVHGKRVKVFSTAVAFSAKATENGAPATVAKIVTTANGKVVGGASGSFRLAPKKSATVVATARLDSDSGSVPTGVTATATDLFFHDLGSSGCTATPIFQGLPCVDATLGGSTLVAKTTVRGY